MYYDLTKAPHEQNIASRKCLGASLLSGRQRKQRIGRSTSDAPDPYVVCRYQSDWGRHLNRRKNPTTHNVAHPLPSRPTNLEFLGAGIRPSGRPDLYGLSKISAEALALLEDSIVGSFRGLWNFRIAKTAVTRGFSFATENF